MEGGIAAAIRQGVRAVDPSLPLPVVRPLDDALDLYLMPQRLAAWVSGAMGAFGLLLALVGIYGTTAFLVSRRAREMAIRMASKVVPGARAGDPVVLLAVPLVIAATTALAMLTPVRRLLRTPLVARLGED